MDLDSKSESESRFLDVESVLGVIGFGSKLYELGYGSLNLEVAPNLGCISDLLSKLDLDSRSKSSYVVLGYEL